MVQIAAMRAASSESGSASGGVRKFVAGPAMEKNIRSTPIPAANNIDAQVNIRYLGRECSGPSRVLPTRPRAMIMTKSTMIPAVRMQYQPRFAAIQFMEPKITVSACPGAIQAHRTKAMIRPAVMKNTGLLTLECLNSSEEPVLVGSSDVSLE